MSGRIDRPGPLVEAWVRHWWPWLMLAVGAVLIATGGFLFSPGVGVDRSADVSGLAQSAIAATATS